ncbi:MAG: hypothetical protein AAGG48_05780 [Planctomycetota bacterium]
MSFRILIASAVLFASSAIIRADDDPVFSGPQVGEKLVPFKVIAVGGPQTGAEVDPIARGEGKPMLLVFVHKLTRPGIALAKGLTGYATSLEGAATGIVWLDDDKAKAEAYLTRARNSLNFVAPIGVSVDGGEGPGAYGLNRNVELTILVAKENKVTANFALVQPSVTEASKIAAELAKLLDKPAPTAEQLAKYISPRMQPNMQRGQRRPGASNNGGDELRTLMRGLINAADDDASDKAIKAIDEWIGKEDGRRAQVKRMANAVLERGLGSEKVQEQLKKWRGDK